MKKPPGRYIFVFRYIFHLFIHKGVRKSAYQVSTRLDASSSLKAAQHNDWLLEPEIERERQHFLIQQLAKEPNIKLGTYPFKGAKLSRADIEWLLITHEDMQGPVDWADHSQRQRKGLDLRGANLEDVNLDGLPLAATRAGLDEEEWMQATPEQRRIAGAKMEKCSCYGSHLEGAYLREVHLERAYLRQAFLTGASLRLAHLEEASLRFSHLEEADLRVAHLERTDIREAYLQKARLGGAHLEGADIRFAHLEEADLKGCFFDSTTKLEGVTLNGNHRGALLSGVQWGGVDLSVIDWLQVKHLGDEYEVHLKNTKDGVKKDAKTLLKDHNKAIVANRQLAVALQAQGLNEDASYFAYRAHVLQRDLLWLQISQYKLKIGQRLRIFLNWIFSCFLFLLAGYGYKLGRSLITYLLVISIFSASYHFLDPFLPWKEAFIISITAFHGRGFSPTDFHPGDQLSLTSAVEAFVGLIIEVTLIATLTQRFFNK